jgi:ferrous iron transport protein A
VATLRRSRKRERRGARESAPAHTCKVRLGEVEPGSTGTISSLECSRLLKRRLMDMGIVAGTRFTVERVAPLGDPMELKLNGFNLSLRKKEAGNIWVEVPCD